MTVKLLTEHNLEFLSSKGGCIGSSESIYVKMPHCWKSHVAAYIGFRNRPTDEKTVLSAYMRKILFFEKKKNACVSFV